MGPDERGMESGRNYPRILRAGYDNDRGTAWNYHSVKSGRTIDALSMLERAAGYKALIDPTVLDLREQYPAYDIARMGKYLDDLTRRIPRSQVPTFDLLLTRKDSQAERGYSYEAVFIKYYDDLASAAVQRRMEREQRFCDALNWRWTLCTEQDVPEARVESARILCLLANSLSLDAVRHQCLTAVPKLLARVDGRPLKAIRTSLGRALGIAPDQVGPLIAAMALHGFIEVDLDQPFEESSPLCLMK